MKLYHQHNGRTCVALSGLVERGYPELKPIVRKSGKEEYPLWYKWSRETRRIGGTTRPGGNGRLSLIEFDYLPPKYREDIRARYGSPAEAAGKESLQDEIKPDREAAAYYSQYTYGNGNHLPQKHQQLYTANACVLNLIKER